MAFEQTSDRVAGFGFRCMHQCGSLVDATESDAWVSPRQMNKSNSSDSINDQKANLWVPGICFLECDHSVFNVHKETDSNRFSLAPSRIN